MPHIHRTAYCYIYKGSAHLIISFCGSICARIYQLFRRLIMDRREMLKGTVGGLMLAAAGNAVFAAESAKQPAGHEHMHVMHGSGKKNQSLIDAAADCMKKGQACLSHGIHLRSQGENKGMAICAMRVSEMIAACAAIEQL